MKNKKLQSNIGTNVYILSTLKQYLNTDSLSDSELANIINWKSEDILKLENSEKELRPKELNLISKYLGISINSLFPEVFPEFESDSPVLTSREKKVKVK